MTQRVQIVTPGKIDLQEDEDRLQRFLGCPGTHAVGGCKPAAMASGRVWLPDERLCSLQILPRVAEPATHLRQTFTLAHRVPCLPEARVAAWCPPDDPAGQSPLAS